MLPEEEMRGVCKVWLASIRISMMCFVLTLVLCPQCLYTSHLDHDAVLNEKESQGNCGDSWLLRWAALWPLLQSSRRNGGRLCLCFIFVFRHIRDVYPEDRAVPGLQWSASLLSCEHGTSISTSVSPNVSNVA